MRYIKKNSDISIFSQWKRLNPNLDWKDFSKTKAYLTLRNTLINEQKNMCCYCELLIENNGESCHIEHLKDKHNYPSETFEYNNLLASCQHTDSCGHKKGTNYSNNFVSPLLTNCQSRFTYTQNGNIIPFDENDNDAKNTIEVLGLNCKRLVGHRKSIIKILEIADNEYVSSSLVNYIEWFHGFYTVIEYMYNKARTPNNV